MILASRVPAGLAIQAAGGAPACAAGDLPDRITGGVPTSATGGSVADRHGRRHLLQAVGVFHDAHQRPG
jgi:hypothetical protein